MRIISQIRKQCQNQPKRVVFPESDDPRVVAAADQLVQLNLAIPILISESPVPNSRGLEIETVSPTDEKLSNQCAEQLYENRKHRGLTLEAAQLAVSDRLLFAALLVKTGFADAAVAGSLATTANVIRAGLYGIGTAPGKNLVSSFFLMEFPDRCWAFADCGVVPDPNAKELAQIAVDTAVNFQQLTKEEPRIAMLSFSTKGSAEHPAVAKVRQATQSVQESHPELAIDGELQFDAAMIPQIGAKKAPHSSVAGKANVFIFPDLNAGNIGYKIAERLGGANAIGPIIQGLSQPYMDLSRGCDKEDIVNVATIAAALS